jgi:hypothetical protein
MKIASETGKTFFLSALAFALVLGAGTAPASAADNAPLPVAEAAPPANPIVLPMSSANTPAGRSKNLSTLEDQVSDSVKNVVKQLATVDSVNLDDLNTARQAVVKLEVLIDIEKHLAELDKIRSERGGERSIAAAIPASALSAPVSMAHNNSRPRFQPSSEEMPAAPFAAHTEVTRVSGTDGHYEALIQGKFLRVGDNLSDGSTIVSITPKNVATKAKSGTVRQMRVNGVEEVYGPSL